MPILSDEISDEMGIKLSSLLKQTVSGRSGLVTRSRNREHALRYLSNQNKSSILFLIGNESWTVRGFAKNGTENTTLRKR
ncbi:MAG TPA: hypothetical protein VK141_04940 [Nitrosomonas sp.]|nr:hypothetical protein [Nitrosomonas sp.]